MIKIEVYTDGSAFIEGKEMGAGKPFAQSLDTLQAAIQAAMRYAYRADGQTLYKVQGVCIWYEPGCINQGEYVFPEVIGDESDDE